MADGTAQSGDDVSPISSGVASINVAFWNLQNLFDVESSAIATDLEYTPVNGWDKRSFLARLSNLAEVVRLMFEGRGPDLLGLCEIENERVAKLLIDAIGREDYALAHVEHPDIRGIDTTLIYSTKHFDVDESKTRGHLVHPRYPSRDIFEVHLKVKHNNSDLVVLVNHWPSRRKGRLETEPFRMTVASHCSQVVDSILKLSRRDYLQLKDNEPSLHRLNVEWDRNVLLMGDLNDEPWDRSVMEIMKAGFSQDHIHESIRFSQGSLPSFKSYASRSPWLYNPMWSLMGQPDQGTYYSSESTQSMKMLDQFLLSRGLLYGLQGLQMRCGDTGIPNVQIFRPGIMSTRNGRPREFRPEKLSGYSDHFPITTTLDVLPGRASASVSQ
ncbi:MAG: hypothetical protein GY903_12000 [Fuerstiella sp.]|nr:hypothetical protein [Fuerstiella sp.]MCP4855205.1 hypothetical protein [Fuerstiella sp.]